MLSDIASASIAAAKTAVNNDTIAQAVSQAAYQQVSSASVMKAINDAARTAAIAAMSNSIDKPGVTRAKFLDMFRTTFLDSIQIYIDDVQTAAEAAYRIDDGAAKKVADIFQRGIMESALNYLKDLTQGDTFIGSCRGCDYFSFYDCFWDWFCFSVTE